MSSRNLEFSMRFITYRVISEKTIRHIGNKFAWFDDWLKTVATTLPLNRDSPIIGQTRVKTAWTLVKPLYRYHVDGNASIIGPIADSKAYIVPITRSFIVLNILQSFSLSFFFFSSFFPFLFLSFFLPSK